MRRTVLAIAVCCLSASCAPAQDYGQPVQGYGLPGEPVGMPGVTYSGSIGACQGGQLYPYDRQDPWLHGHFQRMPAYGGFSSFRPYNYRHVFAQTQIAASVWGSSHGMPYSQQWWNRYRTDYLNGNVHSQASARPAGSPAVNPVSYHRIPMAAQHSPATVGESPVHVFPNTAPVR